MTSDQEAELIDDYNRVSKKAQDLFNQVFGLNVVHKSITDVKDIPKTGPLIKILTE
jgi:hypothetical protein